MSISERSDIVSGLYRVRADLGVIYEKCRDARAVGVGVDVLRAQHAVNEAIEEFQPDSQQPSTVLEFPRSKF